MFLLVLGGSLVFGAGLLAAASYSEGTLLALRNVALVIGWLFVLASTVGLASLRPGSFGKLGAATVTLLSGTAVLYVAYFQWDEALEAPLRHAAAETFPAHEPVYKAMLASMPVVSPAIPLEPKARRKDASAPTHAAADPCASLSAVESLQCRRCAEKLGVAWIVCRESARLEYCQGREGDEATCPSAIPFSPPG